MTEPVSLAEQREQLFLRDLERGKYPAITAGGAPVRKLMAWMEDGGLFDLEIAYLLIYNAAAEIFRRADTPEQPEELLRDIFDAVLADLHHHDP
jgi:hypothetical protein